MQKVRHSAVRGEISEVGSNAESNIIDKLPLLALPHSPHRHRHHHLHHQCRWTSSPSTPPGFTPLSSFPSPSSLSSFWCGSPTAEEELSFDQQRCYWRGRRKDGPIVIKNLFFIQFRIRQKNNDLTLARPPGFDIPPPPLFHDSCSIYSAKQYIDASNFPRKIFGHHFV